MPDDAKNTVSVLLIYQNLVIIKVNLVRIGKIRMSTLDRRMIDINVNKRIDVKKYIKCDLKAGKDACLFDV